ncbi:MAG: DUF4936 family protein [Pseudomonadota bacterium]|nr:DUF4936 family protein [Pseudomonadota bacterium]
MTRELCIYFRAAPDNADAVRVAVVEMQSRLRGDFPGLQARLLRRTDASRGFDTWMETYAIPSDAGSRGVTDVLGSTIERRAAAWGALLDGPRHIESFEPCA